MSDTGRLTDRPFGDEVAEDSEPREESFDCACPSTDAIRCIEIHYPEVYEANGQDDAEFEECQCSCHEQDEDYSEDW